MSSQVRKQAKDLNGAIAGNIEPNPDLNTIDAIGEKAGVEAEPSQPLNIYETLQERDQNRLTEP